MSLTRLPAYKEKKIKNHIANQTAAWNADADVHAVVYSKRARQPHETIDSNSVSDQPFSIFSTAVAVAAAALKPPRQQSLSQCLFPPQRLWCRTCGTGLVKTTSPQWDDENLSVVIFTATV